MGDEQPNYLDWEDEIPVDAALVPIDGASLAALDRIAALEQVVEQIEDYDWFSTVAVEAYAGTMGDIARKAKAELELINRIARARLETIRHAGSLLAQMERGKAGRPDNTGQRVRNLSEYQQALEEAKLHERQARRWQAIASIPDVRFNDFIHAKLKDGEIELTSGAVYKYAMALRREERETPAEIPAQHIELPSEVTYTRVPHYLIRQQMKLGEEAFRVAMVVVDKTIGYGKQEDIISVSQFQYETGLSYRKARQGIKEAVEAGAIIQQDYEAETHIYSLPAYPVADTQKKITKETKKTKQTRAEQGALFEAVLKGSFNIDYKPGMSLPDGHVNAICRELRKLDPPPSGEEMAAYYAWWQGENPDLNPIQSADKLPLSVAEYRQHKDDAPKYDPYLKRKKV
jgi:hypothetical protein